MSAQRQDGPGHQAVPESGRPAAPSPASRRGAPRGTIDLRAVPAAVADPSDTAAPAPAGETGGVSASIIIRTKNEAANLGRTLTGVLRQELPPHEVIVIDSGSTDGTLDVARRFPVTIMEIAPEEWNYSRALNRAAERATGDVLVCLSAHCEPVTESWLGSLGRHFADPLVAGVWGPSLRPGRDQLVPGPPQRQLPGTYTVHNRTWGLSNGNAAIRRARWLEIPFDEGLPATEDKAWGLAMLDRGYVIVHEPEAAVWHEVHTAANDYRRNLAVQAGFRQIFPELDAPYANQIGVVARRAGAIVATRLRERDPASLWADVKRLPGVAAALTGGVIGVRAGVVRRSWNLDPASHRARRGQPVRRRIIDLRDGHEPPAPTGHVDLVAAERASGAERASVPDRVSAGELAWVTERR